MPCIMSKLVHRLTCETTEFLPSWSTQSIDGSHSDAVVFLFFTSTLKHEDDVLFANSQHGSHAHSKIVNISSWYSPSTR